MRITLTLALSGYWLFNPADSAQAANLQMDIQIPRINVAEYHRPYIAIWLENSEQQPAANLALWYMTKATSEGSGEKWLPDLRQWWRKSGRTVNLPIDGVSGPTRPAGMHQIKFDEKHPALAKLPPGNYTLVVEAVREVGGRELIRLPLSLPLNSPQTQSAQGQSELGSIQLQVK